MRHRLRPVRRIASTASSSAGSYSSANVSPSTTYRSPWCPTTSQSPREPFRSPSCVWSVMSTESCRASQTRGRRLNFGISTPSLDDAARLRALAENDEDETFDAIELAVGRVDGGAENADPHLCGVQPGLYCGDAGHQTGLRVQLTVCGPAHRRGDSDGSAGLPEGRDLPDP